MTFLVICWSYSPHWAAPSMPAWSLSGASRFLLKNLAGSTVKLAAMLALAAYRSSGLFLARDRAGPGNHAGRSRARLAGRKEEIFAQRLPDDPAVPVLDLARTTLATVIGILPLTMVPIEVLAVRGAAETARFAIALLIAGFLNFIPSVMGQVLFAEIARGGSLLGKQLRKALRRLRAAVALPGAYAVAAPLVLRLFGQAYAADATGCLRVLALSALPAGGTYLIDSILIARDRTAAYTFMQISNAALILGVVGCCCRKGSPPRRPAWPLARSSRSFLGCSWWRWADPAGIARGTAPCWPEALLSIANLSPRFACPSLARPNRCPCRR